MEKLKPKNKQKIVKLQKADTEDNSPIEPDNQTFRDNWCMLMVWVGMYSGRVLPAANVLCSFMHFVFFAITMYHSLQVDYDMDLLSASIDYVLMISSACGSIINCQFYSSCITKMVRMVESNFHDYEDSLDHETVAEVEQDRAAIKGRKQRVANLYFIMFGVAGVTTMCVVPFFFPDPSRNKVDIINRNVPVPLYYPFRTDDWLSWIIATLAEYWTAAIVVLVVSGTDIPFACFSEEGVFQLKRLGHSLRHSPRRARYVYMKRYGQEVKDILDPRYVECIKFCLNHSVKHHYTIIKFFKEMRTHYFYMLLIIMLGSTFLLCLSGILFMADNVDIGAQLRFLAVLIAVLLHTLSFNWYGELISETSWQLRENIYDAEWQESSRELKPYMLIMMAYLNKPIKIDAGGFMTCNLNTYGNVLSSAYSYFNLLTAMRTTGEKG